MTDNTNNQIGNISHSRIDRIEQKIEHNTVLSEEIREAILLITALMKEDLEWKREERGKTMIERLTAEQRNYRFSVFNKFLHLFLVLPGLWWLYLLGGKIIKPLFNYFSKSGFSSNTFIQSIEWCSQYLTAVQSTILTLLLATVFYVLITAFIASWIGKYQSKRKYFPKFKEVEERFGL